MINWAARLKVLGWCDHPECEVVVRNPQLHGPLEESNDSRVKAQVGEELESRTVCALVGDADELLHDRFGILMRVRELCADLFQGGQRELRPDLLPDVFGDGAAVYVWHAS